MVHHFKLRWSLLFVVLAILLVSGILLQVQVVQAINTPWLTVSGRYIKDPGGNTVILRGVSIVDVSVANSRSRNAQALIDMATDNANGWYARVMRFPVYPEAIDGQPGWIANPDTYFNNHLNPAIQRCISKQIYCIIDWHYIKDYNSSAVDTATRNFWSYVAPKYKDVPNVIFELYNEPINPDNWSTWKTWAQPWVNIIRAAAPNNLILIGGPRWSQNVAQAATNPFSGGNIAYVAHVYPQHGGQSTWDSWFGNSSGTVPYFITEWGWQNGGANPTSGTLSGYGTPFSNYLDAKGVSWTAWVFDLYWQPVMFDTNWNLLGGENYMGQFTKDFLYRHRDDNLPGGGGSVTPTYTPTRTNTPTVTRTPTRTPTPSITPTGGPGNLPDLVITSIVFDGGTPVTCGAPPPNMGDRVYIRNNGSANAGSFSVTLNGNKQMVSGLAAGQTTSVLFNITVMSASATVDADNQVTESNEGNNTFTASLPVPTPPPTCTPTATPTRTPTPRPGGCVVTYTVNQWNTGFTADVKITNNGTSTISGWTLTWSFANGQQITNPWNATVTQTGANVSASNPAGHWNGTIGANGGSVNFGFQATHTGTNAKPTNFVLNGTACTTN